MRIESLRVTNFRLYDTHTVTFDSRRTVIRGPNGTGKTSILEALHIALRGVSFRDSDPAIIKTGRPWYTIDLTYDDGETRSVTYKSGDASKTFGVYGVKTKKLKHEYKYPVILFEPDDVRIILGSPTRRRDYIDTLIAQVDPVYQHTLRRYERALKQRNRLLKYGSSRRDERFVWEVSLSRLGAMIIKTRLQYIERMNAKIKEQYDEIAHSHDQLEMHYSSSEQSEQQLLHQFHQHQQRDELLQSTSVGPHRHDIAFIYNGGDMKRIASRGEIRTTVIALKYIENNLVSAITGVQPVVLFDDVFSELDTARRDHIILDNQVVITHAE